MTTRWPPAATSSTWTPTIPDTAQLYARQLRELGRTKEAIAVLTKGARRAQSEATITTCWSRCSTTWACSARRPASSAQAASAFEQVVKELAATSPGPGRDRRAGIGTSARRDRPAPWSAPARSASRPRSSTAPSRRSPRRSGSIPKTPPACDHHLAQVYLAQDKPDRGVAPLAEVSPDPAARRGSLRNHGRRAQEAETRQGDLDHAARATPAVTASTSPCSSWWRVGSARTDRYADVRACLSEAG